MLRPFVLVGAASSGRNTSMFTPLYAVSTSPGYDGKTCLNKRAMWSLTVTIASA
jgi:hypothetical protein